MPRSVELAPGKLLLLNMAAAGSVLVLLPRPTLTVETCSPESLLLQVKVV